MRIYLQTPGSVEQPPRFVHLILERDLLGGWNLVKESGYQGSAGRLRREHFTVWEAAEAAMVKWRDAQLKRGYRVVFAQGQEHPG